MIHCARDCAHLCIPIATRTLGCSHELHLRRRHMGRRGEGVHTGRARHQAHRGGHPDRVHLPQVLTLQQSAFHWFCTHCCGADEPCALLGAAVTRLNKSEAVPPLFCRKSCLPLQSFSLWSWSLCCLCACADGASLCAGGWSTGTRRLVWRATARSRRRCPGCASGASGAAAASAATSTRWATMLYLFSSG